MNIDWECPFIIRSPTMGDLPLNTPDGSGRVFRLNPQSCVARRGIRATTENIPLGDGEIFHDRYTTGSELQLAIQLWQGDTECACDDVLVDMYDDLRGHLWSMLRPVGDGGRVLWTPAGKDQRMIDASRLLSLEDPSEDSETGCVQITCVIDTPFPYAIQSTQSVVNVNGGGSVTNNGNVDFWPVMKLYTDGGTIVNNTTGLEINIFSGCLGGGSYLEIDSFRNTIYVDGDQANAKSCLDPLLTDFFPIVPGTNSITTTGSTDFLLNDAFA